MFNPRPDGVRPKYKVGEVANDLYALRSEIAHGAYEDKRFSEVIGFWPEDGTAINDSFTRAQVLEECSLFLLQTALMSALSTELAKAVENAASWRKYLDGKHHQP